MVLAFAGLSTITSFFDMARDTLAACWDTPRRGAPPQSGVHPGRRPELAPALRRLPAPCARPRSPAERGLRPRGEPQLELRPLAPGTAPVPEPLPPLHGQVRALLDAVQAVRLRRRRVSGAPRGTRHRGARDRHAALPGGAHRGHVPRRDAPEEGAAKEVRGAGAHRSGQDRARGGRATRAGGDYRHRPARPAGGAAGGVRAADRARRPGGARGRCAGRDRAADGRDRRARELRVNPLLIVDGDSFAHRYYHALPKSIRRADGGGGNLLDGVGGLLVRLWDEESPRAVLVAWDTLTVPTYRHTALPAYPSDRIPGARGVGPKTAASLLAQYGSLETALDEGRFAAEAESLRLYRHIATMDSEAPLPPLEDQRPTWDRAAALAEEWGLARLAG